jgi:TolB-like protein/thioredoxin-like negative regulator of GroEL
MSGFFAELKRRNVYKVAVSYAVVAWLLIQAASILLPAFDGPSWLMKVIIVIIAAGFVISMMIAWAFEMTPEGLKRTEHVSADEKLPYWSRRKFAAFIGGLAFLATALLAFQLLRPLGTQRSTSAPAKENRSIAVLPFDNLSDEKANAYFASGIQDEILTRLSKIGSLKVISRSSTQQYQTNPGNLRDIGQQLGVGNLLEGSVQKSGDTVHINVQLIRAATDEHIWAESYSRKLDDIFAVEAEVASAIAEALNAKLTGAEEKALASRPTNNSAAYDAYLRGLDAENQSFGPEQLTAASQAFAEAAKLDPNFALAWAHEAMVDSVVYFQAFDRSPERLNATRLGADTAMRLAPESVEAWLAKGFYLYRCIGEYDAALRAFEEAGKRSPDNPEVLAARAAVERRRGNYENANGLLARSLDRDPRNVRSLTTLGDTLMAMRRPADARRWFERARSIHPEDASIPALIAQSHLYEGNIDAAGQILDPLPPQFTSAATFAIQIEYHHLRRDWPWLINAIQTVLNAPGFELNGWVSGLYPELGWDQRWAGDEAGAQRTFKEAREKLEALRAKAGDNGYITGSLSSIEAGAGNCDVALRGAEEAISAARDDHYVRALLVASLAIHEALCGRNDEALTTLGRIMREPISFVHVSKLRWGMEWDGLRADARFQKLVADAEAAVKAQAQK